MASAVRIAPKTGALIDVSLAEQLPSHLGAQLTVAAVKSRMNASEIGERRDYVDMLSDLIEGDPHAFGVLNKLYSRIANSEYELVAAQGESESEDRTAIEIAGYVDRSIRKIREWRAHVLGLLWGHFYGAGCREIVWARDTDEWRVDSLELVHSRRVNYDSKFKPYISELYVYSGLYLDDYPAKFILFVPTTRCEYATREGLGRVLAYWMAFKRFAVRDYLGHVERFGKPLPLGLWSTSDDKPRPADEDDIAALKDAVRYIGRGSQPGMALPDSVSLQLLQPESGAREGNIHQELIELCNSEISKAVLGGTLTTEVGDSGSRALGERQGVDQEHIEMSVARQLDDTITRDLVRWIVALNFGYDMVRLAPRYHSKVEREEDLASNADVLMKLSSIGLKIPEGWAHDRFGVPKPDGDEEILGGASAAEQDTSSPAEGGQEQEE